MSENITEVVRDNVEMALDQADDLLGKAAEATGEEAKELQDKAQKCLLKARSNIKGLLDKTSVEGREIAGEVNDCVHSNPWRAVGVAAVGGLLLGLLIARK